MGGRRSEPTESRSGFAASRRRLLTGGAAVAGQGFFAGSLSSSPLDLLGRIPICRAPIAAQPTAAQVADAAHADCHLTIGPVSFEIAPGRNIRTTGYNGGAAGPLIRLRENRPATIIVENKTASEDLVHWHGLHIPSSQDGAMEEGSPMISPGGSLLYQFEAKPAGSRWYHSHVMAGDDLTKSLYAAEYGFLYVEPGDDPGRYDQEVFLILRHWEPYWASLQDLMKGPPPNNGLEVLYKSASINGRAFGHGEPIRVRKGQKVLFRILNASPTLDVMLALPGHSFKVLAMDGNPVPKTQTVDWLMLAPAERIDCVVDMNQPGVWTFGSLSDKERASGMGIVVEYADAKGEPIWLPRPMPRFWNYAQFARDEPPPEPDARIELVFQKILGGRGRHNTWTINGKSWPSADPIKVEKGKRYRISMHNLSFDMHPIHLHRHSFEVTSYMGRTLSGLIKDVVSLPGRHSGDIDFVADNPGPSLFHCHMQDHQDFGFMTLVDYV